MVNIAYIKTSVEKLRAYYENSEINSEFVIYTGNNRKDSKYLFLIHDWNDDDIIKLKRAINPDSEDFAHFPQNNAYNLIPITDLTQKELKEVLVPAYYDLLKDIDMFRDYEEYVEEINSWYTKEAHEIVTEGGETKEIKQTQPEIKDMNKDIKTQVIDQNTRAAKAAAQMTAGKVLNKTLLTKVRPHMPMMMRGYADHALANVVVANVAAFAVANFASDNRKAAWATNAMMMAAMAEFMESFNIEAIVEDVLSDITVPEDEKLEE